MGRNPEHRFAFIQSRASAVEDDAIDDRVVRVWRVSITQPFGVDHAFELERNLELRIVAQAEFVQHLVTGLTDDRGARIGRRR